MGLALDEPREGDESHELDGLNVIIDPFAAKMVRDSGGVAIRNSLFGPMAELQSALGGGCG